MDNLESRLLQNTRIQSRHTGSVVLSVALFIQSLYIHISKGLHAHNKVYPYTFINNSYASAISELFQKALLIIEMPYWFALNGSFPVFI